MSALLKLIDGGATVSKIDDTLRLVHFDGKGDGIFSVKLDKMVVPAEWSSVRKLTEDLFDVCAPRGNSGIFSISAGALVLPTIYEIKGPVQVYPHLYMIGSMRDGRLWGVFSTKTTKLVMPVEYTEPRPCRGGVYWTVGSFGPGRGVFSIESGECTDISDRVRSSGLWTVKINGRVGMFDIEKASFVVPVKYDEITEIVKGVYMMRIGEKRGIFSFDKNLLWITEP